MPSFGVALEDGNPNNRSELQPGIPRDPCASLIHELKHAADDDTGMWNTGRHGSSTGIPETEVRATTEENHYRDANGLPQRTTYGGQNLPPEAIAPFHWLRLAAPKVTLAARPSKPSFAPGEQVTIRLSVRNAGGSAVRLSPLPEGTISIVAASLTGNPLRPKATTAKLDAPLALALRQTARPVAPGAALAVGWQSATRASGGPQSLRVLDPAADPSPGFLLSLARSGRYALTIRYASAGASAIAQVAFAVR